MELSARNQLKGTITAVKHGAVMSEVTIDIGGQNIVSAITQSSAERLGLKEGDSVTIDAHHRFHAAMFAVSAVRSSESRRSQSNPKFGNTTASSMPLPSA